MNPHETTESAPVPTPPPTPRRRSLKWALIASGAAVAMFIAIAALGIAIQGGPGPALVAPLIAQGDVLVQKGDLPGAIAKYSEALTKYPDSVDALLRRGGAYDDAGDSERALADYDVGLRLAPDNAYLHRNRGATLSRQGKVDEALEAFSRAIELDPNYARAWASRADMYFQRKDLDHAIADYDEAIRLEPRNGVYYAARAQARGLQGKFDLALADADQAVTLRGQFGDYWLRGAARVEAGDCPGGITDLERALQIAPVGAAATQVQSTLSEVKRMCESAAYHVDRGLAHQNAGRLDEALAEYTRAIELDPASEFAWWNRSTVYAARGQYSLALDDLRDVEQGVQNHGDWQSYAIRGLARLAARNCGGATSDLREALARAPGAAEQDTVQRKLDFVSSRCR